MDSEEILIVDYGEDGVDAFRVDAVQVLVFRSGWADCEMVFDGGCVLTRRGRVKKTLERVEARLVLSFGRRHRHTIT